MNGQYKLVNHPLLFNRASGTSRGVLLEKGSTFILGFDTDGAMRTVGEISTIPKLSPDADKDIVAITNQRMTRTESNVLAPAVDFGIEMWQKGKIAHNALNYFDTPFSRGERGIPINGLIWMGEKRYMREQIKQKINEGFRCIKLKIGAIDFDEEISLISSIRNEFSSADMEIRVDANGAFSAADALEKLTILSALDIHSIEQPIRQGQWEEMALLCSLTPLPIALDEELIGIIGGKKKEEMLACIMPQYIILKPSLVGGWKAANEWIDIAESLEIGWWNTSALESNVGLHAIASWTDTLNSDMPQGLGTGGLFSNNVPSPLEIRNAELWYNIDKQWDFSLLK
ncbi:MAG: O-succinylbenzoate synthase [Saprospiraceae bacterium]|jgi:O-succinylbenzoate synthase